MRSIATWAEDLCDPVKQFYDLVSYRKGLRLCDTEGYREAYVCFSAVKLTWVQYLLKENFQHCVVIYKLEEGAILLDFKINRIEVITLNDEVFNRYLRLVRKNGGHILRVKKKAKRAISGFVPTFWKPNNCVLFAKNLLGINTFAVWTPYQLYKHIKKNYQYMEV